MSATFFFAFFFDAAAVVLVVIEPTTPALTSPVEEEDDVVESVGDVFKLVCVRVRVLLGVCFECLCVHACVLSV